MAGVGFYVQVDEQGFENIYYNMVAELNSNLRESLKRELANRPISAAAQSYINGRLAGGKNLESKGPAQFGVMTSRDINSGELEFVSALDMQGITAQVSLDLAYEILAVAKYYCPVDTGNLRDSGRVEPQADGSARIYFDCPYAWYVHEFSWKQHAYPTCDHFLTRAIYEVEKLHGYGWA